MSRIVTLLTDFGTRDHYVAAVKGVLLSINPTLLVVDITHDVDPHNIREGAFVLASAFQYFPPHTIHLAVVDPGVGGQRYGFAAATKRHLFVGPDNGLFDWVFAVHPALHIVALENVDYQLSRPSTTFHGRDIFAPAAAHLSLGLPLEKLGPPLDYQMRLPARLILQEQDKLNGEIIYTDRFGNLISNIEVPYSESRNRLENLMVYLGSRQLLTGPTAYEQAPPLSPFVLIGSSNLLEVSVRQGNAEEITGCGVGTPLVVYRQR
jgi:S-adenosylmethionine hydrolase